MVKSRVAEDGRQIKRGNKKKKRKVLKIFLFVLLFFIIILGAVGGKVYFDLKTAVTKAYVNPPTQMTSVSLKKKEAFTTAILGISKIDLLILTHGDYDHIGDTINLLNEIKVDEVLFNNDSFNDTENKIIKALDKKNVRYSKNSWDLKKIEDLYFLNTKMYDNENDNSTVVYFTYENFSFLFTGDASKEREEDIMGNYNIKDVSFLKVGHHGSKTSTGSSFIKNINPKYSIISVGENNRYGHPNKNTLKNLKDTTIFRTDLNGSIKIKLKKNKYEIKTCGP